MVLHHLWACNFFDNASDLRPDFIIASAVRQASRSTAGKKTTLARTADNSLDCDNSYSLLLSFLHNETDRYNVSYRLYYSILEDRALSAAHQHSSKLFHLLYRCQKFQTILEVKSQCDNIEAEAIWATSRNSDDREPRTTGQQCTNTWATTV